MRFVIFVFIALAVTFWIYIYPFFLLSHLLFATQIFHIYAGPPTLIMAILISTYLRTHSASPLLQGLTHYGMGFGFLGFCIFNTGLLLSFFVPVSQNSIGLVALAVFAVLSSYSLKKGRKISIRPLRVESPKITNPARFVFISDVHLGSNPRTHLEKICQLIEGETYDFLLIGGDLFDSSAFAPDELSALQEIKKPIYFVTGNHEYYVRDYQSKLGGLGRFNIAMLDNQRQLLDQINLIGISDNQRPARQASTAKQLVDESRFNLLLVHQPSAWPEMAGCVDLMLSGHTHNGQIFPFNYLVRLQFKTVYGLFQQGQSRLYVSSGAGTWGPPMRLGTQNEIVLCDLLPGG